MSYLKLALSYFENLQGFTFLSEEGATLIRTEKPQSNSTVRGLLKKALELFTNDLKNSGFVDSFILADLEKHRENFLRVHEYNSTTFYVKQENFVYVLDKKTKTYFDFSGDVDLPNLLLHAAQNSHILPFEISSLHDRGIVNVGEFLSNFKISKNAKADFIQEIFSGQDLSFSLLKNFDPVAPLPSIYQKFIGEKLVVSFDEELEDYRPVEKTLDEEDEAVVDSVTVKSLAGVVATVELKDGCPLTFLRLKEILADVYVEKKTSEILRLMEDLPLISSIAQPKEIFEIFMYSWFVQNATLAVELVKGGDVLGEEYDHSFVNPGEELNVVTSLQIARKFYIAARTPEDTFARHFVDEKDRADFLVNLMRRTPEAFLLKHGEALRLERTGGLLQSMEDFLRGNGLYSERILWFFAE